MGTEKGNLFQALLEILTLADWNPKTQDSTKLQDQDLSQQQRHLDLQRLTISRIMEGINLEDNQEINNHNFNSLNNNLNFSRDNHSFNKTNNSFNNRSKTNLNFNSNSLSSNPSHNFNNHFRDNLNLNLNNLTVFKVNLYLTKSKQELTEKRLQRKTSSKINKIHLLPNPTHPLDNLSPNLNRNKISDNHNPVFNLRTTLVCLRQ